MLAHIYRQYTISSRCLQVTFSNESKCYKSEVTTGRREERKWSTAIDMLFLFSCSTVFECSSNDGSLRSWRHEDTQNDFRSSARLNRAIFDHHRCAQGRNRAFPRSSSPSNHASREEMRCSSWATSRIAVDDWNSDCSLHVNNVQVACWRLPAMDTAKVIALTDQQQTKIYRLQHPPTISQVPFSTAVSLSYQ